MDASLDQILSFMLLVFGLFYFVIKRAREKAPEKNEATAKKLRDFLESLDEEMKEQPIKAKEKPIKQMYQPPVLRSVPKKTMMQSNVDDDIYGKRSKVLDLKTQADAPSYDVIGKETPSRSSNIISRLKSKKEMVILNEIFSAPKSMRNDS